MCYLEDANAECAICWKTVYASVNDTAGVTKMTKCVDANVKTAWIKKPPAEMVELQDYDVVWDVSVPGLVVDKNLVPHANIHSCIAKRGACTPFVANSPGLATHTAAIKKELTKTDGTFMTEFESKVNLKNDQYTIIAHTRLMVNEGQPKPTKYDIAIGISRDVKVPDVESSTSSIITAGVAGGCVLLVIGGVILASRKGVIQPEKLMMAALNGPLICLMSLVLGLGDVTAFTFTLVNLYQFPTATTADLLPIAFMVLIVGWLISLIKAYNDIVKMYDNFILGGLKKAKRMAKVAAAIVAKEEASRANTRTEIKYKIKSLQDLATTLTRRVHEDAALLKFATELAQVNRKITVLYLVFTTIFLEQIPLCVVSLVLLVRSEGVFVADALTLFFSAMILGGNSIRVLSFPGLINRRKELLTHFTTTDPESHGPARITPVLPARIS